MIFGSSRLRLRHANEHYFTGTDDLTPAGAYFIRTGHAPTGVG
jgi:hypothetical protein